MMKTSLLLGILLSGFATIVGIVSAAIPYWWYTKTGDLKSYGGLWKVCSNILGNMICSNIPVKDASDWFRAVQALVLIGIVLLGLSALLALCYARFESQSKFVTFGALDAAAGAILFVIAVVIYGVKNKDTSHDFHAGFYLGIITAVLGFFAAIAILNSKRAPGYSSI